MSRLNDRPGTPAHLHLASGGAGQDMKVKPPGLRRLVAGWAIFTGGLAVLLWLHTFRDRLAHSALLPGFLLLWLILAVSVWDGRQAVSPRFRWMALLLQALAALLESAFFFLQLLRAA